MEEVIADLDSMGMDLVKWQEQLREISWPSRPIALLAKDLIRDIEGAKGTLQTLTGVLVLGERAKVEANGMIVEDESQSR